MSLQEQEAMAHRAELDRLRAQREELGAMLGQHRETVRMLAVTMMQPLHAPCLCMLEQHAGAREEALLYLSVCEYCGLNVAGLLRPVHLRAGVLTWCTCNLLQVHAMTKDTQDIMARAQAQSDTADAQAAELQRVRLQTVGSANSAACSGCLHYHSPGHAMAR